MSASDRQPHELAMVERYREQLAAAAAQHESSARWDPERWRFRLGWLRSRFGRVAVAAMLAALVVVAFQVEDRQTPDAAARAYAAATTPPGQLLHVRSVVSTFDAHGTLVGQEADESWNTPGGHARTIIDRSIGRNAKGRFEATVAKGVSTTRRPDGSIVRAPIPEGKFVLSPFDVGARFQRLYRRGLVGAGRQSTLAGLPVILFSIDDGDASISYTVDAHSYSPVEVKVANRDSAGRLHSTIITRVEAYEHLPVTAATKRFLQLGGPR